jgi:hypothetical protein
MMMNKFRDLKVDEVELRINRINEYGCSLLLYKDARCDMSILDETVGPMNWKREHTRNNANCIVSIWDEEKKQWISKEDTGKESYAEKEKGQASDSFKRACVNWGIGRELYTAPDIWIQAGNVILKDDKNGKKTTYDKFSVVEFEVEDKKIVKLAIRNDTLKKIVYTMDSKVKQEVTQEEPKKYECHNCGKPFQPFTDIDGKVWSVGQVYHLAESSAKKAGIAGVFCSACLKKKQEAKA